MNSASLCKVTRHRLVLVPLLVHVIESCLLSEKFSLKHEDLQLHMYDITRRTFFHSQQSPRISTKILVLVYRLYFAKINILNGRDSSSSSCCCCCCSSSLYVHPGFTVVVYTKSTLKFSVSGKSQGVTRRA